MRQSQLFAKTKKETPKEAETISHKLLARGDFIEQLGSGIYVFLPLGLLVRKKVENIVREALENIGAQELLMPVLQPKSLWEKTGRWDNMEPPLFKLKDRHKKELALGPTHEEIITYIAGKRIKNSGDLPQALFQIQTKFRNEMRASGGLLRTIEFLMKDLYSFHADQEDFLKYYELLKKVYEEIFARCGLETIITEASGAGFTKEYTHEFQVICEAGEDTIFFCSKKHFSQNKEIASVKEGDKCPVCGDTLKSARAVEVGNIFPLGKKYSEALGAFFLDLKGKKKPALMGCYGIGIDRVIATIVEVHHDEKGIIWPKTVAPFNVHLLALGDSGEKNKLKIEKTADEIYLNLKKAGIEVLYDDRGNKTPGEKFADADLLGMPQRIVISERTLRQDSVEVKERNKKEIKLVKTEHLLKFLNYAGKVF
jgi:prolyl-tRNA synthetase